ncbi:MAG: tripartite tricarboxylate transporter substrate binding protein [Burkholderiales bacterium]|nr:tripartite tricarboxylate transporter substrate binding protein [Burkholderiales bacterium]
MKPAFKLSWQCAAILTVLGTVITPQAIAASADYPNRPVRLIVGFPPGGAADILARAAGQQLAERLGQQIVIDNRGGAGGLIATETTARANADGYTLLFSSIPHVINPHLYKKVAYDALKDFSPVVQFVAVPLMMAAGPSLPAQSVKELIDYAKANPGKLNYGSAGSGSSSHLAVELFKSMAGIRMEHIPYKGTGPLITDILGGQIGVTIASAVPLAPQVRSGKLRGLAVTGSKRSPAFPTIPAIAETVKGYEVVNWFGVFAPAGVPKALTARINSALNEALRTPELLKTLQAQGAEAVGGTPEDFDRVVRADFVKWGRVVKESGARVD